MNHVKILIVEDEQDYCAFLRQHLEDQGHLVVAAHDGMTALDAFTNEEFDLVFLDHRLPGKDGVEILRQLKAINRETPIVMMTAYGYVQTAVQAIKSGAYDYVAKEDLLPDVMDLMIAQALEQRSLRQENERLRQEVSARYSFDNVVGKSAIMREIFQKVQRIAPFNSTVLISGESGTGKEVIARLIHLHSRVRNHPFITINCAAIPETLLESELFGYNRGAFSGAVRTKHGLFEEANNGTLLLDEIGELPTALQVKLLRVLQEGKIRRLGDVSEISVDVRIIAATSRNLATEVREGRFREDLFYRLNIIPIVMPSLRERPEDIPLLIHHFLKKLTQNHEPVDVTPDAMQVLMKYPWPGNVRELQNIVERAIVLSDSNKISMDSLPQELRFTADDFKVQIPDEQLSIKQTLTELVPRVEKELIARALKLTNNNRTRAARLLEISHRSLLYKLKEYHCR
ncbi:sigma-54-dependent Fis family transcriptional regulator [candidate division KSB1 bacterium]|nr:MAG: sigma-54-dependent Fis family transcriptional regulator [candidate division KSB1 bacterium]